MPCFAPFGAVGPCGIPGESEFWLPGMLKMSQCTTGPFGGGTSMSCSTSVNAPALAGPPDQLSGGDVWAPAQVNSVGKVSPSLNALLVSVNPGVAVPVRIICGIATGLPAASGLAAGLGPRLAAGLAAGFAAAEGLAAAEGAGLATTDGAGLVAGLVAAGAVVAAGAAVGVLGALLHATRNAAQSPPRVARRRCI